MTTILFAVAVGVVVLLWSIRKVAEQLARISSDQAEKLDDLTSRLDELSMKLDRIEYNTLSAHEKQCRTFYAATTITLQDAKNFRSGEIVHLIEQSFIYPHENSQVDRFLYRHGTVGESAESPLGVRVVGEAQYDGTEAWHAYDFFANETQCQTTSGEGSLRRL